MQMTKLRILIFLIWGKEVSKVAWQSSKYFE